MNYALFRAVNALAGRVDAIDDAMEFIAVWLIFIVGGVAAVVGLRAALRGRLGAIAAVAATLGIAFLGTMGVASLNLQQRPFQTHHVHQLIPHDAGTSLPSDHATAAFTIAMAVGWFLHRGWGAVLLAAAVLIGLARVWVGVHYPGDIVASLLIAAAAVASVALLRRLVRGLPDPRT